MMQINVIVKLFLPFFIVVSLVGGYPCFSQQVQLQGHNKSLILCVPNHLFVSVQGQKASSIFLTTNNGEIDNNFYDGKAHYTMWARTAGPATIYVKLRIGGKDKFKILDSTTFNVVRRHYGRAGFGIPSGELKQSMLRSYPHLIGPTDDDLGEHHRKLYSFTVIVYRSNREVFKRNSVEDGFFDSATTDFFRYQIEEGDRLIFANVKMKDCDHQLINLESEQYTIVGTHLLRPPRLAVPDTQVLIDPVTGNEIKKILWYRD